MGRFTPGSIAPVTRRARAARPQAEALEERIALAVYSVTNTADAGPGSLRQAIVDANNFPRVDDTIVFDPAVFSTPREIDVISPLPQFGATSGGLTIIGPGSSLLTVRKTPDGPAVYRRVFDSFSPTLTMSGMTVTGGDITANGGGMDMTSGSNNTLDDMVFTGNKASTNNGGAIALSNNATLTIRNSVITGNSAKTGGGIVFFDGGSLVMENCTVSGNTATSLTGRSVSGGGIYFFGVAVATPPPGFMPSTLYIRDSTISNNTAPAGGGGGIGLENMQGTLLVRNSTVSGNSAGISGGGIMQLQYSGGITLENSTVTNNAAGGTVTGTNPTGGGGIMLSSQNPGSVNVTNSVVSGNTNPRTPDILTTAESKVTARYSAIGNATGFTLSAASGNNLPYGTNLLLGPLAANGGPTQTHALLPGSPLVNAGSNALVPADLFYDQRGLGFPRIVGTSVDIGAFERTAPPKVAAVFVRGAAWGLGFRQFIQTRGLGESALGFSIPGGADQLKTLPWTNVDTVSIRFSQDVSVVSGNLSMRGVNVPNYAFSSFQYEPVTHTGIWTLAQPLRNDKVLLDLDGDAGGVSAGGSRLDGEWADGTSAFPSGNDTAGGDFRFRFNSLPGDVDRSGSVLANDYSAVKQKFFSSVSAPGSGAAGYTIFHDVNANGTILADDFSAVKSRFFDSLPGANPTAAATVGAIVLGNE